jgi:trimethylamine:corrinoid methyltransferase-like protein
MPRDEGRRQKREARRTLSAGGGQSVWQQFRNPLPALALLNDDELGKIDDTALRILEELGLEFQNPQAIEILADSGADVDRGTGMVRMDRHLVRRLVAKAPSSFTLHARNPERNVIMGEDWINFAPVAGPPNVSDLEGGRRPGTFEDQCNLIKLPAVPEAFFLLPSCAKLMGKATSRGRRIGSSIAFAQYLLEDWGVVVVPGSGFEDDAYFRLSMAAFEPVIVNSVERIAEACLMLM